MSYENHITDDLDALLSVLPEDIRSALEQIGRRDELLEVILDLGRVPTARFTDSELVLREPEVAASDIQHVVQRVGEFDADNRAGAPRTLHRISAIRNRKGDIVGLTCRVGRAVYGTISIIEDIIESGKSALLLGRPGVGKTTMLREAARVLGETRRVIVVDTSNEIGGDGDIPHPAVGSARRMQVALPTLQHEVMIEAVENHNPEVIIIDEIGRALEAEAARTIAERGVQLIATAHGNTLDNLLLNPTLSDLIGGVESVTLSDEEARRRGTQKTILERRAPPTFDVLIEIQDRQRLLIHHSVAESVDALLRGRPVEAELRYRDGKGQIHTQPSSPPPLLEREAAAAQGLAATLPEKRSTSVGPLRVFPYGVSRDRLDRAAQRLQVPVTIVNELGSADAVITTKGIYRKHPRLIKDAERRGLPLYVLRANTIAQMESCLDSVFSSSRRQNRDRVTAALNEASRAIEQIRRGEPEVELSDQDRSLRRLQHELAQAAQLDSHSVGEEPHRRVRILRRE
jgi:stage III sporulation protein SpoIIIAA